jgi:hypothetical protein
MGGIVSSRSTQYLLLGVYINCNSNHCPVATSTGIQLQLNKPPPPPGYHSTKPCFHCNSASTAVATPRMLWLQLLEHFDCNSGHIILIILSDELQLNNHPCFNTTSTSIATLWKSLQLQLNEHSGCNSTNASIATPSTLQMQLWTCNFYNFYQTNCNSTSTTIAKMASASIATPQSQQLQLRKHSSCNMIITSIATFQNFSSNSKHVNFL